ncbi:MAG: carbon-nitrogen hydrolase family protein [Lachnospiraceae bacterium]|nr:carbon-nitrogen hydrolase family protein [Lachnospiraceae bacterium]
MKGTFVLAQMASEGFPEANLEKAKQAVPQARERYHADVVIFPEYFMSYFPAGTAPEIQLATRQPLNGPFVTEMCKLAKENHVWLVFGMNETVEDPNDPRQYNTVVVTGADGEIVSVYRKTHLYDAFGYKESDIYKPGDRLFEPIDTPFGKLGLFVCYEVRFPEVARYQRSRGADIILMPTAWAVGKLKSLHFRALITARAIENTVYMLACDQCDGKSIGESVAVDPMGVPIASGGEGECFLVAYVDTDRVEKVRAKLPAYKDRRPELYTI